MTMWTVEWSLSETEVPIHELKMAENDTENDKPPAPVLSFTKALKTKYADYEAKSFENIQLSPRRRAAFIKEQSILQRRVLSLDGCKIDVAGEPEEIAISCPNVQELDLTGNKLGCWKQIFLIVCQLPKLTFLNLSKNPLNKALNRNEVEEVLQNNRLPLLQKLVLNNTMLPLDTVYEILALFPRVEELHLSLNSYDAAPEPSRQFNHVKSLYFVNNGVRDWNCVQNVAKAFPRLKALITSENDFECITNEQIESVFHELSTLSISKTQINNWDSVDVLREFPVLTDVRLVGIPLLKDHGEDERRKLLISRLPNVKKVNGSVVNKSEREKAERMFIRYHMDDEFPPDRYHELVSIHGQLQRLAEVDFSVEENAEMIIRFENMDPFRMAINLEQTEKDLKKLLANHVGQTWSNLRIFYKDICQHHPRPIELKRPLKQLYTHRMSDGDEIYVIRRGNGNGNIFGCPWATVKIYSK